MTDRPDVVVVGGGLAGLSAATRLARAGQRVLVLEARGQLGGRASSFVDRRTGDTVDNGQHVLVGCYRATFDWLESMGASAGVQLGRRLSVRYVDADGRSSTLACPLLPAPWHLLAGVLGWKGLAWRDRADVLKLAPLFRQLRAGQSPGAGETVEAFLTSLGQGPRLRELLWTPLTLAALNQRPDEVEATAFLTVLARMFGDRPDDSAIGLPRVPLAKLFGSAARREIELCGGTVRLHAPARLALDGLRVAGVTVRGAQIRAPRVVLAVPWHGLERTLGPAAGAMEAVVDRARGTPPAAIVTVNLWFDRRLFDEPFVGLPGRTMQWAFAAPPAGRSGQRLALVASGAGRLIAEPAGRLVQMACANLASAFATARRATLEHAVVVREPRATFSLAPGAPARPGVATGVAGLWMAGDWVDTGLPATIEGAIVSGRMAAEAVLG